jgi:hypothetical protein
METHVKSVELTVTLVAWPMDASFDICTCRRLMRQTVAKMRQNQIPAPASTPFKALSIARTVMVVRANRWNAAALEDMFAFK